MSIPLYRAAVLDRIVNCIKTLVPSSHGPHEELVFYVATGGTNDALMSFVEEFPFTSTINT